MRIGSHDLDLDRGLICREGQPVRLRAKTFALLGYLARNAGRVVGKAELLDAVWPDVTVTEDSLTQAVSDLRKLLGGDVVQTVPRRGYILVADDPAPRAGDRPPVVVILPFHTLSDRPEDIGLADALAEEITQGLGRYGLVRVIARHSAFQFRPETLPPQEAARSLCADWFVTGPARRVESGLRLSPCLCETESGRQIWSESFTLGPEGPAEVFAAIPHAIVTRLILDAERNRTRHVPSSPASLGAWQHFVAGVAALRRYGPGVNEAARDHFRAALDKDPQFALVHAYLGLSEVIIGGYDLAPPEVLERALSRALHSIDLAPDEARCHAFLAMARLYRREFEAAERSAQRAVKLNPSDPDLMAMLGYVQSMRGKVVQGLRWMEDAARLNPLHPDWYNADIAVALHMAGRPAEAISRMQCLPKLNPWKETRLAACHAALGDAEAAALHLDRADALSPGWDALGEVERWAEIEHVADREYYAEQVRLAVRMRAERDSRMRSERYHNH